MREADFYAKVRERLHAPPFRVCKKLQDRFIKGVPVCVYSLGLGTRSTVGRIELKYHEHWPKRGGPLLLGVRVEQARFLEEWAATHGNGWLVVGIGLDVYVFKPPVPLGLRDAEDARARAALTCRVSTLHVLLAFLTSVGLNECL